MIKRREFVAMTGAAALYGLGAGVARAQEPSWPDFYPGDYGDIVEGSRQEGRLLIYTSIAPDQFQPVIDGFTARYPWIQVEHLESSAYGTIERYNNEVGTNSDTASVIFAPAPDAWIGLIERDQLIDYASPEAPNLPAQETPHPGLYAGGGDPLSFVWNKLLVPEELWPTSFEQMVENVTANPDLFNGRVTTYAADRVGFGYSVHYALARHHGDRMWDWYSQIGPLTRFETAVGTILEKIQTGEYFLGYLVANQTPRVAVQRDPRLEEILGISYMSDGTVLSQRGIAVTRGGASPNAGKLMLDYILSHEGQVRYANEGKLPARDDVTSEELGGGETYASFVAEVGAENVVPVGYDDEMVTGYEDFVARWQQANGLS